MNRNTLNLLLRSNENKVKNVELLLKSKDLSVKNFKYDDKNVLEKLEVWSDCLVAKAVSPEGERIINVTNLEDIVNITLHF